MQSSYAALQDRCRCFRVKFAGTRSCLLIKKTVISCRPRLFCICWSACCSRRLLGDLVSRWLDWQLLWSFFGASFPLPGNHAYPPCIQPVLSLCESWWWMELMYIRPFLLSWEGLEFIQTARPLLTAVQTAAKIF